MKIPDKFIFTVRHNGNTYYCLKEREGYLVYCTPAHENQENEYTYLEAHKSMDEVKLNLLLPGRWTIKEVIRE